VRALSFLRERLPLQDAETMLLIDSDEPQIADRPDAKHMAFAGDDLYYGSDL
jgi:hypothetical protein